ncbi:hypothetical protein CPB83DRAFT_751286, partial [Crepidotus variabilis]
VYRLHWLRARAQRDRWAEELENTEHEMTRTVLFFIHQAAVWKKYRAVAEQNQSGGEVAYCEQQIHMWNEL